MRLWVWNGPFCGYGALPNLGNPASVHCDIINKYMFALNCAQDFCTYKKFTKKLVGFEKNCDHVSKNNTVKVSVAAQKYYSCISIIGFHPNMFDLTCMQRGFVPITEEKKPDSVVERCCWADLVAPHQARARLPSVPPADPLCLCLLIKCLFVGISSDKQLKSPLTATTELLLDVLITLMVLGIIDLRYNFSNYIVIVQVCFYANGWVSTWCCFHSAYFTPMNE